MYRRILCPYDGSEASNQGLVEAARFAHDQQARLRIVTIVEERQSQRAMMLETQAFFSAEFLDLLIAESKMLLNRGITIARRAGVDADGVSIRTVDARSAERIIEEAAAWKADLIVMGTHGRRGINRLILGSDAELVVRLSPIPVMLVRAMEQAATGAE